MGAILISIVQSFLSIAGRVREAAALLFRRGRWVGAVLWGVAKGIHSKMKKFADGYMWDLGVWGARDIIQDLSLLEIQKTDRAAGLRIRSKC